MKSTNLTQKGLSLIFAAIVFFSLGCAAGAHAGTVWSWGVNDDGQLGDGTTIPHGFAQQVPGLTNVESVATGGSHSLALKADGTVFAWGANGFGQLGIGTTIGSSVPVEILGLSNVVAIAAGSSSSLALDADGFVWAWGDKSFADGSSSISTIPEKVANLTDIVAIASFEMHNMALKSDGSVWGWGRNNNGRIGDGTTALRYDPVQVVGLSDVTAIACGLYHSLAVTSRGDLYAWGRNSEGQLGDGSNVESWVPVKTRMKKVAEVAGGGYHSLALKTNGTAWAWGSSAWGQLGNGTYEDSNIPVQVNMGLSLVNSVSAGIYHSFGIIGGYPQGEKSIPSGWGRNPQSLIASTTYPNPTPLGSSPSEVFEIATQRYHALAIVPKFMRISSITMSTSTRGKSTRAIAEIQVVDDQNNPLDGVWVEGRWSGLTNDTEAEYNASTGEVTFTSDAVKNADGIFTIHVGISKYGYAEDEVNGVKENSISFP